MANNIQSLNSSAVQENHPDQFTPPKKNDFQDTGISNFTLLPISQLLSSVWNNYRSAFGSYTALAAIQLAVLLVLYVPYAIVMVPGLHGGAERTVLWVIWEIVGFFVPIIGSIIFLLVFQSSFIRVADQKGDISKKVLIREGFTKHLVPVLWVMVLNFLAVLGGYMLFIIPGIIVMVWLMCSIPLCVIEEKRGIHALQAARLLVKGRWWSVFARIVIFALILSALSTFVFLITFGTGIVILALVVPPITAIFPVVLYQDLKRIQKPDSAENEGKGWITALVIIGLVGVMILPLSAWLFFSRLVSGDSSFTRGRKFNGAYAFPPSVEGSFGAQPLGDLQDVMLDSRGRYCHYTMGPKDIVKHCHSANEPFHEH